MREGERERLRIRSSGLGALGCGCGKVSCGQWPKLGPILSSDVLLCRFVREVAAKAPWTSK